MTGQEAIALGIMGGGLAALVGYGADLVLTRWRAPAHLLGGCAAALLVLLLFWLGVVVLWT